MTTTLAEFKLKPKEELRLRSGHCWIFSNELQNLDTSVEPGTLCKVITAEGKQAGIGFFNPHSLIAIRLLTSGEEPLEEGFITKRLKKALRYRKEFGLEKYARVCFGEADFLPGLVVDRYGDYLVADILAAGMDKLVPDIKAALDAIYAPKGILFPNDSEFRKLEGLVGAREIVGDMPESTVIEDSGISCEIPLLTGQKTGFYYDQRDNRNFLTPYFKDKVVMDLYCYVGSFAVKAAVCGAHKVIGIDSSPLAIEYAMRNAAINNVGDKIVFHREDSERALSALRDGTFPQEPDMIIVDPPNYVRSKKNLPQALKHYSKINEMALCGLTSGGMLATATCAHHVSRELFIDMLRDAAKRANKNVTLVELRGQAADHPVMLSMPETEYLHFALLQVR